jgi:hypothetical protein
MRVPIYSCFFIFLFSCGQRKAAVKPSDKDSAVAIIKDSIPKASVDTSRSASNADSTEETVYKELTHLDIRGYHITVLEDHSEAKDYLVAYNKATKKADTIGIDGPLSEGDEMVILDATDSLQIKPLLLEVICPTGSDWYNHAFVGYDSGRLKQLFDIDNFADAVRLRLYRKDKLTLAGHVLERDKLVQAFEEYPVEVSLKDYKVTFPDVPALYVGWESEVLESFKARRVIKNQLTDSFYTVKKGAHLTVDTLYVPQNKVRLRLKKSVILETSIDNVKDKISENGAG